MTKLITLVQDFEWEIKQLLDDYIDVKKQDHVFATQCSRGFIDIHLTEGDIPTFKDGDWITEEGYFKTVDQLPLASDFNTAVVKINLQEFSYKELQYGN